MGTVRNILISKGNTIHFVDANVTVYDALAKLMDLQIGALLVLENGKYIGIFTERDYARKVILKGRASKETIVKEICDLHPSLHPDMHVEDVMQLMVDKRFRHFPVFDKGELVGVISIGDVMRHIHDEQRFIIEQQEHYIHS